MVKTPKQITNHHMRYKYFVQIIGAFLKTSIDHLTRVIGQIIEGKQKFVILFFKNKAAKSKEKSARCLLGKYLYNVLAF
jgi:hypothetical protein